MKALLLCHKGTEEITQLEVKELLGKKSEAGEGFVVCEISGHEDICTLCYQCQSISKAGLILSECKEDDLLEKAKGLKCEFFTPERSFKVEAKDEYIRGEVGKAIKEATKMNVDLEKPDIIVYVHAGKRSFFALDFSGRDISKRNYRIFNTTKSIKASLAYAMVRMSEYKAGERLLDCFCTGGSIAIEASLFRNRKSPHYFQKEFQFQKLMEFDFSGIDKKVTEKNNIYAYDVHFQNVDAARKNAKIAEIHKTIEFSRVPIEWLDLKFEKGIVDRIVTCVPAIGKYSDKKMMMKLYKELFHQAEFTLSKKGIMILCTHNPSELKECAEKFTVSEIEVWQGEGKLTLLKMKKN